MPNEYSEIADRALWKAQKIAERYQDLKRRNGEMQAELESLRLQLRQANVENADLVRDLATRRTAAAFSQASPEVRQEARDQLTQMIRRVDRCLQLLSV